MTTRAIALTRWRSSPPPEMLAGALAGLVIGAAAASSVTAAAALTVVVILGCALAVRPSVMLMVLIAAVFVEAIRVSGVTVGRIVAPVALLALVLAMLKGDAKVRRGAPLMWAIGYSLWALASGLWTVSASATSSQLISLAIALVYLFSFAGWVERRVDLERVLMCLAVVSLSVGLFAIFSYITGGSLLLNRAVGGAGDPNFFAAYQIFSIPLMLVLANEMKSRRRRNWLYLAVLIVIASVLTTLSRGGLLALGAIVILTVILPARTLFRSRAQKTLVVVSILLAGGVGYVAVAGAFAPRLSSLSAQGGGSGRLVLWQGALTAIKERPLTGLGYGGFQSASDDLVYRTPGVSLQSYDLPPTGQVAHSAYLGTAAELGIPGLVLFLGLIVSTALALRRHAVTARAIGAGFLARIANALNVSLAGWVLASLFLSSETSRPLWMIVGLTLALPKLIEQVALSRTGT